MFWAFVSFYFRPTLKSWRALRRKCMKRLPAADRKAVTPEHGTAS